jgi:hypothetical protein
MEVHMLAFHHRKHAPANLLVAMGSGQCLEQRPEAYKRCIPVPRIEQLLWCADRGARVIHFWMAFSNVVIIVGGLDREAWKRYRWDGRPLRRPSPVGASYKRLGELSKV